MKKKKKKKKKKKGYCWEPSSRTIKTKIESFLFDKMKSFNEVEASFDM